jgi:hypothetical protein
MRLVLRAKRPHRSRLLAIQRWFDKKWGPAVVSA